MKYLSLSYWTGLFGDGESKQIGVYGPPNSGKTTFTARLLEDWSDDAEFDEDPSEVPHATREVMKEENVTIEKDGSSVEIDIFDTPGQTTKVDYTEFVEEYDMDEEEAKRRSREATSGVAEAMSWLKEDDIDGVIYVLDSAEDPFVQVNTMLIGIIENKDVPIVVLANKTDKDDARPGNIRTAFPQHSENVVEMSALEGDNIENVYDKIVQQFG